MRTILITVSLAIILSACAPAAATTEPATLTPDVSTASTQAVATIYADLTAAAPTNTPTPIATPLPTPTPDKCLDNTTLNRLAIAYRKITGDGATTFITDLNGQEQPLIKMPDGSTSFDWSPDGSHIAFGGTSLYTVNADGSSLASVSTTLYTLPGPIELEPFYRWSPDGRFITFIEATSETERALFIANADGSNKRQIGIYPTVKNGDVESTWDYFWSPDGQHLAVVYTLIKGQRGTVRTGIGSKLEIVTVETGESKTLIDTADPASTETKTAVFPARVVWSPSGQRLAFLTKEINLYRLGDEQPIQVANLNGNAARGLSGWNDAETYLLATGAGKSNAVFIIASDGSAVKQLTQTRAGETAIRTSHWIEHSDNVIYTEEVTAEQKSYIRIVTLDGDDTVILSVASGLSSLRSFSPDGRFAAFTNRDGITELYNLVSNEKIQFAFGSSARSVYSVEWSPDSRYVMFYYLPTGEIETVDFCANTLNTATAKFPGINSDPTFPSPKFFWKP